MALIGTILLFATLYWFWRLHRRYRGRQWWRHSWPAIIALLVSFSILGTSDESTQPTVKTKTVTKTHLVTANNDKQLTALQAANRASASSLKQAAKNFRVVNNILTNSRLRTSKLVQLRQQHQPRSILTITQVTLRWRVKLTTVNKRSRLIRISPHLPLRSSVRVRVPGNNMAI